MIAYESLVEIAVHVGAFRGIVSAESSWSIRCAFSLRFTACLLSWRCVRCIWTLW